MKKIFATELYRNESANYCVVYEINRKRVKIVYECRNALERCTSYMLTDEKLEPILSILDLGVQPNNAMYLRNNDDKRFRCESLVKQSIKLCKKLLS